MVEINRTTDRNTVYRVSEVRSLEVQPPSKELEEHTVILNGMSEYPFYYNRTDKKLYFVDRDTDAEDVQLEENAKKEEVLNQLKDEYKAMNTSLDYLKANNKGGKKKKDIAALEEAMKVKKDEITAQKETIIIKQLWKKNPYIVLVKSNDDQYVNIVPTVEDLITVHNI